MCFFVFVFTFTSFVSVYGTGRCCEPCEPCECMETLTITVWTCLHRVHSKGTKKHFLKRLCCVFNIVITLCALCKDNYYKMMIGNGIQKESP